MLSTPKTTKTRVNPAQIAWRTSSTPPATLDTEIKESPGKRAGAFSFPANHTKSFAGTNLDATPLIARI